MDSTRSFSRVEHATITENGIKQIYTMVLNNYFSYLKFLIINYPGISCS